MKELQKKRKKQSSRSNNRKLLPTVISLRKRTKPEHLLTVETKGFNNRKIYVILRERYNDRSFSCTLAKTGTLRFKLGRLTKNKLQSARLAPIAKTFSRLLDIRNVQALSDLDKQALKSVVQHMQ